MENIKSVILSYFREVRPKWEGKLNDGVTFAELAMDSMDAVRFVAYLQGKFKIKILPKEYISGPGFKDLSSLCSFIQTKMKSSS